MALPPPRYYEENALSSRNIAEKANGILIDIDTHCSFYVRGIWVMLCTRVSKKMQYISESSFSRLSLDAGHVTQNKRDFLNTLSGIRLEGAVSTFQVPAQSPTSQRGGFFV